jgi:hypothetical protein
MDKLSLWVQQVSTVNERTGNVVENKGPLWQNPERSGNVYENKDS